MKPTVALLGTLSLIACTPQPSEERPTIESDQMERSDIEVFAELSERGSTRILYLANTNPPTSPGQIVIDYGQPSWKDEYEADFDELTLGKRWRFGNNSWTYLDTNVALRINGTEIAPGHYYLVLERTGSDQWFLELLDPARIRAQRLDAFFVYEAPAGTKAPLTWQRSEEMAERLSVRLIPVEDDFKRARLEIRWGNHMLTAGIEVQI